MLYRYKEGPSGERVDMQEVSRDEAKKYVRYKGAVPDLGPQREEVLPEDTSSRCPGSGSRSPRARSSRSRTGRRSSPSTGPRRSRSRRTASSLSRGSPSTSSRRSTSWRPDTDKKVKETGGQDTAARAVPPREADRAGVVLLVGKGLPVLHQRDLSVREEGRKALAADGDERGHPGARRRLGARRAEARERSCPRSPWRTRRSRRS